MAILSKPFKVVRGKRNSQGRFYLGDCLDVFKQLPAASIDVIVT